MKELMSESELILSKVKWKLNDILEIFRFKQSKPLNKNDQMESLKDQLKIQNIQNN